MLSVVRVCRKCGTEKPVDDFPITTTKSRNGEKSWTYPRPECHACYKALMAERFQQNKEKWGPTRERWYRSNRLRGSFTSARTRARRAGATQFMSLEQWTELRKQTHCHWCSCELKRPFTNVDHIRPLAWGGQHTAENVVLACANCNMEREWHRKTKYAKQQEAD